MKHIQRTRLLRLILVAVLALSVLSISVFAEEDIGGKCGRYISWTLSDGVLSLTTTRNAEMPNYTGSNDTPWAEYVEQITQVTIGDNITSIGEFAFNGCTNLSNVELPQTLETIGASAFQGCTSLSSVTLPNSLIVICSYAFSDTAITSIVIPENVAYIDSRIFYKESGSPLTEIIMNTADASAFFDEEAIYADAFESVTADVYYFGNAGWDGSTMLDYGGNLTWHARYTGQCNIYTSWLLQDGVLTVSGTKNIPNYAEDSPAPWQAYASEIHSIVIEEGITDIGNYAFVSLNEVRSVTLPSTLTTIGKSAFSGCTSLSRLRLPGLAQWCALNAATGTLADTGITDQTFYLYLPDENGDYSHTDKITIPEGVTSIPGAAFQNCAAHYVELPASVKTIGDDAFAGLDISYLYLHDLSAWCEMNTDTGSVAKTGLTDNAFTLYIKSENGYTYANSISIPESITFIPEAAFQNCINLSYLTLPESLQTIGSDAFTNTNLRNIYLPDLDTWLSLNAASGTLADTGITATPYSLHLLNEYGNYYEIGNVIISDSVTVIPGSAFQNCTNLTAVSSNSLSAIPDSAFSGCENLKTVLVSDAVTSIGANAFIGCNDLELRFAGAAPSIDPAAFTSSEATAYYPSTDTSWADVTSGQYGATSLTWTAEAEQSCGDNATWKLNGSTLTISGTGNIWDYTYENRPDWSQYTSLIQSIVIEEGITGIGNYAFYNLSRVTDVSIPEGVRFIGLYAFSNCDRLSSVTLPSSLSVIDEYAFRYSGLTSIVIPEGIKDLGRDVFAECDALVSCTLPSTLESIGYNTFAFCDSLASIHIPASVTYIGSGAFYDCYALKDVYIDDLEKWCAINFDSHFMVGYTLHVKGEPVTELVIPETVANIPDYTFTNCTSITSVNFNSVTQIGFYSFAGCTNLDQITLPEGLSHIGGAGFSSCSSLTSVTIPSTVQQIDGDAFVDTPLTELRFTGNAPRIADTALYRIMNLKIYYPQNDATWDSVITENYGAISPEWISYEAPVIEDGTTPQTAIPLTFGQTYTATFNNYIVEKQLRYGSFTLERNGYVTVQAEKSMCDGNFLSLDILICDSEGKEIWRHETTKTDAADHEVKVGLAPGSYYLALSVDDYFSTLTDMDYSIRFTETDTEIESNHNAETATPLEVGKPLLGHVANENDYFSVYMESEGIAVISIENFDTDSACYYFNYIPNNGAEQWLSGKDFYLNNGLYTTSVYLPQGISYVYFEGFSDTQMEYTISLSLSSCDADSHTPITTNQTPVTCTENGYTGDVRCETCGYLMEKGSVIYTSGHTEVLLDYEPATCTKAGYSGDRICSVCDTVFEYGKVTEALGHDLSTINIISASCATTGYTGDTVCRYCDYLESGEIVDFGPHNWPEKWLTVHPTFTHDGFAQRKCPTCGKVEQKTIPKLQQENPFTDVAEGAWYYDSVLWAARNDITTGTSKDQFSPNDTCTRAQVVTFLWRSMTDQTKSNGNNPFTDIKGSDYFYNSVLWAAKNQITEGTSETTFSPGIACTRAQVVTFLWRASGCPTVTTKTSFTDVPADSWYASAVIWAQESGITTGTGNGKFSPNTKCSRAEIVTFLYRWIATEETL